MSTDEVEGLVHRLLKSILKSIEKLPTVEHLDNKIKELHTNMTERLDEQEGRFQRLEERIDVMEGKISFLEILSPCITAMWMTLNNMAGGNAFTSTEYKLLRKKLQMFCW